MPPTVFSNARGIAHKSSSGLTIAFPEVCKTMSAGGGAPVALPYPGFATTALKRQKQTGGPGMTKPGAVISTSTGNEAGTLKGVTSSKIKGKTTYTNYSFDVKVEGRNVGRLGDPLLHNDKNTMGTPAATAAAAQKKALRGREVSQLRSALTALSAKLGTMTSRDPNDWQNVLQELAVTASALYVTMNSTDDDDD